MEGCRYCGAEVLLAGIPHWSIDLMRERSTGETVDVIESSWLLMCCESCAARRDFDQITIPWRSSEASLGLPDPQRGASVACCSHNPPPGEPYFSVSVHREVIEDVPAFMEPDRRVYEQAIDVLECFAFRYCDTCAEQLDFAAIFVPPRTATGGGADAPIV